jgi:hypothetical protein
MCYVLCRLHQLSFRLSHAVYILSSALISVNRCLYTFCRSLLLVDLTEHT